MKTTIKRKIDYITNADKTAFIEGEYYQDQQGQEKWRKIPEVSPQYGTLHHIESLNKTQNPDLITGYECTPEYAHEEFALTMEMYEHNTGRKHKDNSRLVYHMRQSFKPEEVSPEIANAIGYELALEYTDGKHAFVVATHTDRQHIHNHIIFCAFNLEADGKFRDVYFIYQEIARISDRICDEFGLSVIHQKQGWRDPYNEWEQKQGITKDDKEPTKRKELEEIIALCLEKRPKDFNHLLKYLEDYRCFAKQRGKNISISTPFSKKPFRLNSLSDEFTEQGIIRQIAEQQNAKPPTSQQQEPKQADARIYSTGESRYSDQNYNTINFSQYDFNEANNHKVEPHDEPPILQFGNPHNLKLIIDIENSMKATESIGYKRWAEKFNLEQMSQTLLFIEKHQLSFAELQNMATRTPQTLHTIKSEVDALSAKMDKISTLQKHIGTFSKNKTLYNEYQQSKNPSQFWKDNETNLAAYEESQSYLSFYKYNLRKENKDAKFPTMNELRQQYAIHNADKSKLWAKYHDTKNADSGLANCWANVKTILNVQDEIEIALEIAPKQKRQTGPSL